MAVGQTISAKVVEVDLEKNRCILATAPSIIFGKTIPREKEIAETWIRDYQFTLNKIGRASEGKYKNLGAFKIGDVIKVIVEKITDEGLICKTAIKDINCVIMSDFVPGKLEREIFHVKKN